MHYLISSKLRVVIKKQASTVLIYDSRIRDFFGLGEPFDYYYCSGFSFLGRTGNTKCHILLLLYQKLLLLPLLFSQILGIIFSEFFLISKSWVKIFLLVSSLNLVFYKNSCTSRVSNLTNCIFSTFSHVWWIFGRLNRPPSFTSLNL